MTSGQQWRVVGAIVAVLGGALWFGSVQLKDELVGVEVGSSAPMFGGATIEGAVKAKSLADYKGKVVLLNVWATWCGPCRTEMPSIEALHKAMGPKGLQVVAVTIDSAGSAPVIRKFLKDFNLTFEVLHDSVGAIQQAYQTTGVPETFIIAADGTIRKKSIGAADWNSEPNRALITQLLKDAGAE
ncbi:MAG TPA: TlpA disulfide reductase family protein [Gemmatimonadaceae bacterium]|nr:TlpA disulfide reductase family protein [Gemmatimonadaceae bacterium]